jgi:hypothetical protein
VSVSDHCSPDQEGHHAGRSRISLHSWEQTGKSFRLWVQSRPKVQGRGGSYEKAEEALLDKICMHFGDGEAPNPVLGD